MEYDRYEQNRGLFIVGMICLLISIALFIFSFYILPGLIWNLRYDVPEFVYHLREAIRYRYAITDYAAGWWVFILFFIPALLTGFISKVISNRIDNKIYRIEPERKVNVSEIRKDIQQTANFSARLLLIILGVVLLVFFVEWLIATPPPAY